MEISVDPANTGVYVLFICRSSANSLEIISLYLRAEPMATQKDIDNFLYQYNDEVITNALQLRAVLMANLPDVIEQVDHSAKMIAYCYGQKYAELICVIIPSKKGLKLGFNRGSELPDPAKLLEGSGKISRYVVIQSEKQTKSAALKKLIANALKLYRQKVKAA